MQKELMELYKEHGVNPFASCLPLVAQLPVFIGLYQVLRNQIEPTPVVSFLGIDDIFQKLSSIGGITEYVILGLYVTTMLGSTLLFSFVTDRQQKYMFAAMPIFFIPFVIGVPARRDDLLDHDQHLDHLPAGRRQAHDGPSAEAGLRGCRGEGRREGRRPGGPQGHGQPHPALTDRAPGAGRRERTSEEAPRGRRPAAMTGSPVQVEATGETVGEARWAALHELERRYPALDRTAVEFVVLSEGQRGLLGVGYEPARVIASLADAPPADAAPAPAAVPDEPHPDDSPVAARVRALMAHVVAGLGLDADVKVVESDESVAAIVTGDDLGLLIGRHGHTIDAVQYLANAIVHRHEESPVDVVIDAQGYRARRERTLRDVAARAAADAIRTGEPVPLEPMSSVERKIVHVYLKAEVPQVRTASEGAEPNRHVVVLPAEDDAPAGV